jgi:hypothetical protein
MFSLITSEVGVIAVSAARLSPDITVGTEVVTGVLNILHDQSCKQFDIYFRCLILLCALQQ